MSKKTVTQSFGSSKRENHDSSSFYSRKLYETHASISGQLTNEFPTELKNVVINHSSEDMSEIPDNSVSFMVTSPPYNVGKEYDTDISLEEYIDFLNRILIETFRVLIPGGRVAFNVANLGRKPYIPLNAFISNLALEIGYLMRGEIIWIKAAGSGGSCAWGSWMSASNPVLRDLHEYILIFSKDRFDRPLKGISTITRDDFLSSTTSIWNIFPESAKRIGHPAPFPVSLVEKLIHLYTFEGDIVLDPFMGSGSTAVAAIKTKRTFIGYETNAKYIELCYNRVFGEVLQ